MASQTVACEFDGTVLTLTSEGLEPACPECAREESAHNAVCFACRRGTNLPDNGVTVGSLVGAL